jgi:hypothetical protein
VYYKTLFSNHPSAPLRLPYVLHFIQDLFLPSSFLLLPENLYGPRNNRSEEAALLFANIFFQFFAFV